PREGEKWRGPFAYQDLVDSSGQLRREAQDLLDASQQVVDRTSLSPLEPPRILSACPGGSAEDIVASYEATVRRIRDQEPPPPEAFEAVEAYGSRLAGTVRLQ